jgi:type I restriction enzyme S subunit
MKTSAVPSAWFEEEGFRLDTKPYTSGAVQTKQLLRRLRTEPLRSLTSGFNGGIFTPPIHNFSRNYVEDPEYGVPFVGSTTMLRSDHNGLPLLSKRDAFTPKLMPLRLEKGMTLVSASGTIGRTAYVRRDMDGIWSSGDVMKVRPDPARVRSGYLYAYLSCRFGVPLLVAGTYGTIIQHIEAPHLAEIPVPRLGDAMERKTNGLIEKAAEARARANDLLGMAQTRLNETLGLAPLRQRFALTKPLTATPNASVVANRMDAQYFIAFNEDARRAFDAAAADEQLRLGDVADVRIPGIFKRRFVEDAKMGIPYVTGGDVFQLVPESNRFLARAVAAEYELIVREGMILIQEAGQLGGLIGRCIMVGAHLDGFACSNNMVRVTTNDPKDAGYLFAVLASDHGWRLLSRESAGSSIPHIDCGRVRNVRVPWAAAQDRARIGQLVSEAIALRDHARRSETDARSIVERAIQGEA